jgi:hypothetical protein
VTYADELDHLTRAVAALLEKPEQSLDEPGVQAALSSREALLGLLTVQMAEAAPLDRSVTKPDLVRLAEHPVAAFIGTLREYPRPHGEVAPSVLYSQPQQTLAGSLWLEIGRRSTIAQAEWQGTGQPLTDEQAWSVVSDAAALAAALARLDEDLVAAARKPGCGDLVEALAPPAPARLAIAANEVKSLAGPRTEAVTLDRWRTPVARIHSVARDSDVPQALEALSALLRSARVLKPEHVQQIAISLARVEVRLNNDVTTDLARELAVAAQTPRRAACPYHGDRRPLLLAGELNRWASTQTVPSGALLDVSERLLLEGVAELRAVVRRQLQSGNWLVPDPDPHALLPWRLWTHALEEPEILAALRVAAQRNPARDRTTITAPSRGQLSASVITAGSARRLLRPATPQLRPATRLSP